MPEPETPSPSTDRPPEGFQLDREKVKDAAKQGVKKAGLIWRILRTIVKPFLPKKWTPKTVAITVLIAAVVLFFVWWFIKQIFFWAVAATLVFGGIYFFFLAGPPKGGE